MAQSFMQIPSEVWNHVFTFLPVSDKFCVRATCKYFKKLIDHWSLWKGWSVVLSFRNGPYSNQFWASLRRRKVASVVMRSNKAKHWSQLTQGLPGVSTVVVEGTPRTNFRFLEELPHVKRVAVRSTFLLCDANPAASAQQLTHLSLCGISLPSKDVFKAALSKFTNLTSLDYHLEPIGPPVSCLQVLVDSLPKLKRLSVCFKRVLLCYDTTEAIHRPAALSSLELVNYMNFSLPTDTMRLLPHLRSLSVYHQLSHTEMDDPEHLGFYLKSWLSDLPQLSSLLVIKGPAANTYASSIPATVTSLTLRVAGLSAGDMAAVAAQVPNLLHLHIDPWPSHLGAHTSKIPQLFPKLKSLKIRHEHVPEKDFLQLHQLQDLEHLEVLDDRPNLWDLVGKLRMITKNRLNISTSPLPRDVLCCACTQ